MNFIVVYALTEALHPTYIGYFDSRKWEPVMQWICLAIFMLLVTFAVVWNIFANTWVPGYYPESDYRDGIAS